MTDAIHAILILGVIVFFAFGISKCSEGEYYRNCMTMTKDHKKCREIIK